MDAILTAPSAAAETTADRFQRYYEEAGPDYAAWSPRFNMHFGFFRRGLNPFNREAMLEQMNLEVLDRLRLGVEASVLDMGCGLGATLRSFARRLPRARLVGITLVPWQLEQAALLNRQCPEGQSIRLRLGNYEHTGLPSASCDAVCAIESSCYGAGSSKSAFLREAHRLLRPGGRFVVADGFVGPGRWHGPQPAIYRKLCDCWVIDTFGDVRQFAAELARIGFQDILIEQLQARVTPSVLHVPWVTLNFLVSEVLLRRHKMTRARWNNVLAPVLLPFVGYPLGPVAYYLVSATRV
ncbi:MAG TPA: methyltransferase domain-containing protein [Acidobacteriaceae bacterium]|jgi:SAM-dependent methyltransferase|nr:methyltransferase domain-containing protein [Acidobacteriaceae bacterium]